MTEGIGPREEVWGLLSPESSQRGVIHSFSQQLLIIHSFFQYQLKGHYVKGQWYRDKE